MSGNRGRKQLLAAVGIAVAGAVLVGGSAAARQRTTEKRDYYAADVEISATSEVVISGSSGSGHGFGRLKAHTRFPLVRFAGGNWYGSGHQEAIVTSGDADISWNETDPDSGVRTSCDVQYNPANLSDGLVSDFNVQAIKTSRGVKSVLLVNIWGASSRPYSKGATVTCHGEGEIQTMDVEPLGCTFFGQGRLWPDANASFVINDILGHRATRKWEVTKPRRPANCVNSLALAGELGAKIETTWTVTAKVERSSSK